MLDSRPLLFPSDFPPIHRRAAHTLQVNLGYRCNQSCLHCHVDAGPRRQEEMSAQTLAEVLTYLRRGDTAVLDLTGGAPELNAAFRPLVREARRLGLRVQDRCNLTILEEPGQEDLADFLADHQVEVIASLPCYLEDNVDGQRGNGVFAASIRGLRRLNERGYGDGRSGLLLSLVYNPTGPTLPPPQAALAADYRRELAARHGVRFDHLLTLANMPIARFGSWLQSKGLFADYLALLQGAHRPENLARVMCRDLLSIDWQGRVYDCDFNQMLGLTLPAGPGADGALHIRDLTGPAALAGRPIRTGAHCFGCTAGQGSSCGGALG